MVRQLEFLQVCSSGVLSPHRVNSQTLLHSSYSWVGIEQSFWLDFARATIERVSEQNFCIIFFNLKSNHKLTCIVGSTLCDYISSTLYSRISTKIPKNHNPTWWILFPNLPRLVTYKLILSKKFTWITIYIIASALCRYIFSTLHSRISIKISKNHNPI